MKVIRRDNLSEKKRDRIVRVLLGEKRKKDEGGKKRRTERKTLVHLLYCTGRESSVCPLVRLVAQTYRVQKKRKSDKKRWKLISTCSSSSSSSSSGRDPITMATTLEFLSLVSLVSLYSDWSNSVGSSWAASIQFFLLLAPTGRARYHRVHYWLASTTLLCLSSVEPLSHSSTSFPSIFLFLIPIAVCDDTSSFVLFLVLFPFSTI